MQSFPFNERVEPEKQEVALRLKNFKEIYDFFNNRQVALQAERCVQCGDPFCSDIGCPLSNYIPQWLEAIAEQDIEKAFRLSNESSPFPEVLGRICPQNRLCEGACTLDDGYGAITIGAIEASITDLAFKAGLKIDFPGVTTAKKVAVVGSGPAGISCAHFLLRAGIKVDMFERADKPGGLLTYGIPGFKLDKEIIENRFNILKEAGLTLHLGVKVGEDITFDKLKDEYDAVFIGIGATKGKSSRMEGEDNENVFIAMDFLTSIQKRLFGAMFDHKFDVRAKSVVVIGGGDTAMDCLRTAMREGAKSVTCLYRRDEANMPGSKKEYYNAVEEGVQFLFNESPTKLVIDKDKIVGVDAIKTEMGEKEDDGRQKMIEVKGSEHCIPADVVIMALGFDLEDQKFVPENNIKCNDWGELQVDEKTCRTNINKIYAGGDCRRGADLAVTAAADGRTAAFAIMNDLLI